MNSLKDSIKQLIDDFTKDIAAITTADQLESVRIDYLGRNGKVAALVKTFKTLPEDQKKILGPDIHALKIHTQQLYDKAQSQLTAQKFDRELEHDKYFDVTAYLPGQLHGSLHPLTHLVHEVEDVCISMGFTIADGPEVETQYYNFEALNIGKDHPARDMWDTFYLDVPDLLLRTHTSSVQVHTMEEHRPPIAVVAPGRAYRHEATDATHDFMFMQVEGFFIDQQVSMSNLLATVKTFLQGLLKKEDLDIRVRPSYFPFVEPGIEIDMSCPFCSTGCSTCKKTRWIEICGAGLVHPHVLRSSGIDPEEYSGFAFGFGLTRLAMLKYGINDIRLLHTGNVAFLKQF